MTNGFSMLDQIITSFFEGFKYSFVKIITYHKYIMKLYHGQ